MEFAEHEFTDLVYKDNSGQPYHWLLSKEKEKERKNNSKHFYKHLLGILAGFPSVA